MAITKITTPELFDFSATNTALQLPTGDTASRPSAPSAGEWRYNSELKYVEYYDGAAWFQIDTEAPANPDDFPSQNFNVNTYFGNGATQAIDAKFNEAANFNGSSSRIVLPQYSTLTGDVSVSGWVKLVDTTSSNGLVFVNLNLTNTGYAGTLKVFHVPSSGLWVVRAGNGINSEADILSDTYSLTQNVWYNICFTRNTSTNVTTFYVNGVQEDQETVSVTASIPSNATSIIGDINRTVSGNYNWDGAMDQVRIFNTALTAAQAEDCYTDETTTTAATLDFPAGAGCIAAYQLDGDASDVGGTYGGVTTNIGYTGLKFAPDLVWIKQRSSSARNHNLTDTVRGAGNNLASDTSAQAYNSGQGFSSFDSNGFTLDNSGSGGGGGNTNLNGVTHVAWSWKAGGAPTATNSAGAGNPPTPDSVLIDGVSSTAALAGTIAATSISANTAAGFSIVKYSGNSTAGATVAHGLTSPQMVMIKCTSTSSTNWIVYADPLGNSDYLTLNSNGSKATYSNWFYSNATTFTLNQTFGNANTSGRDYIAYCFSDVADYQKIGFYTGNGSTSGPIVNTGFEPAFVMIKRTDSTANWRILDNKRSPSNPRSKELYPNLSNAEGDFDAIDFFSNGFQNISTDASYNANGGIYLYLAIAADKDSSVPTQANSFSTATYTGTGAAQSIYTPFAPDLSWIKSRSNSTSHELNDSVRGQVSRLSSNTTDAASDVANGFLSLDPNSFSLNGAGSGGEVNTSGRTYVGWNWKAGGLPTINNDGTNITSIVSANQAAGFSIVKYTGIGSTASVGHGLAVAPTLILAKCLDITSSWVVYSVATGVDKFIELNDNTAATTASGYWGTSAPTASVFEVNNGNSNNNSTGNRIIAYCFANSTGYQQAGTYSGSSSSVTINFDGAGFNPSFVMIRRTNATGQLKDWTIFDQSLSGSTTMNDYLVPNSIAAEFTNSGSEVITATSTGFTIAGGVWDGLNASGGEYLYLAVK